MPVFDMAQMSRHDIYKLLIGFVIPRPIAWVSCQSSTGVRNIAAFSYFNAVSSYPPMLGFSVSKPSAHHKRDKDTLVCVRETREFVVNLAQVELLDEMVLTAVEFDFEVDEFEAAGLTPVPGCRVSAPRIAEAPVSFECRLHTTVDLGTSVWVIGEVVFAHAREGLLDDRLNVDAGALRPVGRMPGPTFCTELNVVRRAAKLANGSGPDEADRVLWLR